MRIIYTLLFLFVTICTFAQEETKTHHEETDFFEEEKSISAYGFVFQTHEETNQLWKVDMMGLLLRLPLISNVVFLDNWASVDYERKLGEAFSLNSSFRFSHDHYSYRGGNINTFSYGIGIQPRWYYKMKDRIGQGKQANNLSGNYIGLGLEYTEARRDKRRAEGRTVVGLKYGIQRRIFKRGFIDIQFGPEFAFGGYSYYVREQGDKRVEKQNYWRLVSQVKLGFVFGQSQLGIDAEKRYDVFQCFEERKGMFKIDLLNALNVFFDENQSIIGTVNLAYEFKLAPSVSINNEFNIGYFFNSNDLFNSDNLFLTFNWTTQGRYYYDAKKRVAAGKSSNNLSGNYFGLQAKTNDFLFSSGTDFALTFSPIWGLQRTIFERGYIDYSFGFNLWDINPDETVLGNRALLGSEGFNLRLISQLRIGFRF